MQVTPTAAILLAPLALVISPVHAQSLLEDSRVSESIDLVRRWIDARREYDQIPGISIALVHDQELLWSEGFGYADLETRSAATPETVYGICSISKLFTSVATMRLRDLGKIRLDDPVEDLIPWFELADDDAVEELVSVRSLLKHRSGLRSMLGNMPDEAPYLYYPSREEIRSLLPTEELLYRPWEQYNYSNLGMALLGEIVTARSGKPYAAFVQAELFDHLGMSSTTPDVAVVHDTESLATGYGPLERGGGRLEVGSYRGRGMIPAMGAGSTVLDLAKFASWQFRLLDASESEILEPATLREMYRVQWADPATEAATGLGFAVRRENGKNFVGHSGDCPGYRSDLHIQPDERIAVIVLSNAMIPVWEISARAYAIVAPAIQAAQEDPGGAKAFPVELEMYVGTYEGFPWSGEFQVLPWQGGLAVVNFPVDDPMSVLRRLEHVEGGKFRRVREDGLRSPDYSFEADASGRIVRMKTDEYARARIR